MVCRLYLNDKAVTEMGKKEDTISPPVLITSIRHMPNPASCPFTVKRTWFPSLIFSLGQNLHTCRRHCLLDISGL